MNPNALQIHPHDTPFGAAYMSPEDPPVYRYWLTRNLGGSRPLVVIGLNPSTADATKDDATIRKERGFAQRWGCTWLVKVNAYAIRATKPPDFEAYRKAGKDAIGAPWNDEAILAAARICEANDGIMLAAWGTNIEPRRAREVRALISSKVFVWTLGENKDGSPRHPLYLSYETPRSLWTERFA